MKRPVHGLRPGACFALLLAATGCHGPMQRGQSSIQLLAPIAAPQAGTQRQAEASKTVFIDAIPPSLIGEMARPDYPAGALAAHVGPCVVYVTITIDTAGRVSELTPSWQRLNVPNRFSEEFMDAIRAATQRWRFEPARNVYWERKPGEDNKYLYAEVVPSRSDIAFTFTTALSPGTDASPH